MRNMFGKSQAVANLNARWHYESRGEDSRLSKAGKTTIQDVAVRAGVTAMTVSRVLNDSERVLPETRQRVQRAIDDLGYIPNALARGLLTGRTRTIGILVGDLGNPYWTAVASGAEEAAQKAGYSLVIGDIGDTEEREDALIKTMVSNRVEGLLINAPATPPLKRLTAANYPFVLIGPEHRGIRTDVVRGDVHRIRIGARSNIQDGTVVHVMRGTHPTTIGDDVTIGHGALIHGCTIEDRVLIGMGAIVLNGATVGADSIVAAGTLVTEGAVIPPRSLVMGSPGKVRRPLTDEEVASVLDYAVRYVGYRLDYMHDAPATGAQVSEDRG